MPSPRKRIGFLPSAEVQKIIDEICLKEKLSQSKVTGILVEEALNSRYLNINKNIDVRRKGGLSSKFDKENLEEVIEKIIINNSQRESNIFRNFLEYKSFKRMLSENNHLEID